MEIGGIHKVNHRQVWGDIDQEPTIDCEAWIAAAGPPKKGRVYGFGESLDSSRVLLSSQGSCSASSSTFVGTTTAAKF
ncbi:hypothetical protein Taro_051788 [Colocasia esculenta]|uniref:Uncharacterized protein n=1 Tax=Colocasia esculenta TaxID=4460 RepID=A0A843XHT0_COLES|nr:hypothetical protein [Colocasia esculenta]